MRLLLHLFVQGIVNLVNALKKRGVAVYLISGMCTHARTHMHTHTHARTHTERDKDTHTHTHARTHTERDTHTRKHTHTYTHTERYRHTQRRIHTNTHTHTGSFRELILPIAKYLGVPKENVYANRMDW